MRTQTRERYAETMERVLRNVVEHLDPPTSAETMAWDAGFSSFHFSRMFSGMVGEAPSEILRRLRLERAAYQLRCSDTSVTEIAFDAGFDSLESFTRSFRLAYRMSPTEFRRSTLKWTLPAECGVHYGRTFRFKPRDTGGSKMNVEIKENMPPMRVAAMRHVGPYWQIGPVFQKLSAWVQRSAVPVVGPGLAIYYDDPGTTSESELRSDACVPVPADFKPDNPDVAVVDLPGGRYATTTHVGSYEGLNSAWGAFLGEWLPASGETIDWERPCFELYVDDCSVVPIEKVRTELYEPLA